MSDNDDDDVDDRIFLWNWISLVINNILNGKE